MLDPAPYLRWLGLTQFELVLHQENPDTTPGRTRTVQRQTRVRQALMQRQTDLTVVLENVHDPHNIMAVLRSCDSVGIGQVHVVGHNTPTWANKLGKKSSAGTKKWVSVLRHENMDQCYANLRAEGKTIWATKLGTNSIDLYQMQLCGPIALVFGNEHSGLTSQAYELADGNFFIPQMGMTQSLNISVACAVSLYEAYRQRALAGMYQNPQLSPEALETMYQNWIAK